MAITKFDTIKRILKAENKFTNDNVSKVLCAITHAEIFLDTKFTYACIRGLVGRSIIAGAMTSYSQAMLGQWYITDWQRLHAPHKSQ